MLDFATSTVSRPVKHLGVLLAWMVHRHLAPVRTSPAAAEGGFSCPGLSGNSHRPATQMSAAATHGNSCTCARNGMSNDKNENGTQGLMTYACMTTVTSITDV